MGSVMLMAPSEGFTLFARANALLKVGFTSSKDHVVASPEDVVHAIVAGPPLVQVEGVVRVSALTKGTKAASVLCVERVSELGAKRVLSMTRLT